MRPLKEYEAKVRVYKWVYTGRKVSKGGMGRDMAGWVSKKTN